LVPILPHGVLQRQALLGRIAGIGAPAQCRDELGNRFLVALDRRDLIAHSLAHLLWTVGPTSSTPNELDGLLALSLRGAGEQTYHTMLDQHGLGCTLQCCLLADLAFASSHWWGYCQQSHPSFLHPVF